MAAQRCVNTQCSKYAKRESVYCGTDCIHQHAKDSLRVLNRYDAKRGKAVSTDRYMYNNMTLYWFTTMVVTAEQHVTMVIISKLKYKVMLCWSKYLITLYIFIIIEANHQQFHHINLNWNTADWLCQFFIFIFIWCYYLTAWSVMASPCEGEEDGTCVHRL